MSLGGSRLVASNSNSRLPFARHVSSALRPTVFAPFAIGPDCAHSGEVFCLAWRLRSRRVNDRCLRRLVNVHFAPLINWPISSSLHLLVGLIAVCVFGQSADSHSYVLISERRLSNGFYCCVCQSKPTIKWFGLSLFADLVC